MGPRILKSLAGMETRLIITLLSHSINSDCPQRSILIHNRAPPAFFFTAALLVDATSIAGGGGGICGGAAFFLRRNVNFPISSIVMNKDLENVTNSKSSNGKNNFPQGFKWFLLLLQKPPFLCLLLLLFLISLFLSLLLAHSSWRSRENE